MPHDFSKYIKKALKMGAADARVITIKDIVFDPRTYLKCNWGCLRFGNPNKCPSDSFQFLKPWEAKKIIEKYENILLIHGYEKQLVYKTALVIEKELFLDGYYWAFTLAVCDYCKSCPLDKPCSHPEKRRPSEHLLGIDAIKTIKQLGLPISPYSEKPYHEILCKDLSWRKSGGKQNRYAFILID